MSFRPERLNDGSQPTPEVLTVATITADYGSDPSRVASMVTLAFRPMPRATVDEAVQAFKEVLDGAATGD